MTVQRLTLELEVGVEPLTGVLTGDGFSLPFEGWLSLASALERARGSVTAEAPCASVRAPTLLESD